MTKEELLSQLKSIQIPSTVIPWWQMAFGWYILIAICFCLGFILCYIFMRHKRKMRKVIILTSAAEKIFNENVTNCHVYAHQISHLLKQVVVKYSNKYNNRILSGKDWSSYLKQIHTSDNFDVLIECAYNPNGKFDVNEMHQDVISLLKKLLKRKFCKI
ncbi:MAG: hypothetical protein ACJA0H_000233 [Francisellaceae bacterium]|jgi:hypothetical protein